MSLGFAGLIIVALAWAEWTRRMKSVTIPRNRSAFVLAMALGVVLGLVALARGPGLGGGIAATFAVLGGGVYLGLLLQSSQASNTPAVAIGGPILDFVAPDAEGQPFDLASLRGRPYLLKFFRGHW